MATLNPPRSQKADVRPIGFLLKDTTTAEVQRTEIILAVRPEDLTRTDTSRSSVQQTVGGAFADVWGAGLPTITISGHTGWRRYPGDTQQSGPSPGDNLAAPTDYLDGSDRFKKLRDIVFLKWHAARAAAVLNGKDPSGVQLIFVDALDQFAVIVIPGAMTLRRSRSRPLLMQYQIPMTVIGDVSDGVGYQRLFAQTAVATSAAAKQTSGLDSLLASINQITTLATSISKFIDQTLVSPVRAFLSATAQIYQAVNTAVNSATGITTQLLGVAQMVSQAGANIARTIMTIYELPDIAKAQLMQLAAAFTNVFCLTGNAFGQQAYYQDYSALYGSANCSSTSGGRPLSPLAGVNPFYVASSPTETQGVVVNAAAIVGLRTLAQSDVVLAPLSSTSLLGSIKAANGGLTVAA